MRQISFGIKPSRRTAKVSPLADTILAPFSVVRSPRTACNVAGTLLAAAASGKYSGKSLRRMHSRFYQRAANSQRSPSTRRPTTTRRTRSSHTAHRPAESGASADGDGPAHPARPIHAAYAPRAALIARFTRLNLTGLDCLNVQAFPRNGGAA